MKFLMLFLFLSVQVFADVFVAEDRLVSISKPKIDNPKTLELVILEVDQNALTATVRWNWTEMSVDLKLTDFKNTNGKNDQTNFGRIETYQFKIKEGISSAQNCSLEDEDFVYHVIFKMESDDSRSGDFVIVLEKLSLERIYRLASCDGEVKTSKTVGYKNLNIVK